MPVKVPSDLYAKAQAHLSESRRIASTLAGATTLPALEAALAALDRLPSKAEMKLAIRGLAREARLAERAGTDLAIPPMPKEAAS